MKLYRLLLLILIMYGALFIFLKLYHSGVVLGASNSILDETASEDKESENLKNLLQYRPEIKTITAFNTKVEQEEEIINFETRYEDNDEMEYGTEELTKKGINGLKTYTYKVIYWEKDVIDKTLLSTKIDDPSDAVITVGKKIVWRTYATKDVGRIRYWLKLRVYATKYDANCIGCTGRTYSGTEVVKGVCAVDPKVIKLGTNFYVDGYGLCRAEDVGGLIKGNRIDLGYKNVKEGSWRTGYTDIYLLTSAPN